MTMLKKKQEFREESIAEKIYFIRGEKVLLDRDLAILYGIDTKVLKQAVKRNQKRFPEDFMFLLNKNEMKNLRSQFVTSSWGGLRYSPMAFTEQGVAMLSSVLNSDRAIEVNISIMRTFVKMRSLIYSTMELKEKLKELEKITNDRFKENDKKIKLIFDAIKFKN
jgi:hypothetical protein